MPVAPYPAFERLRSYVDEQLGIREEFLTPALGGGRTIAVLSTPLENPRPLGWVQCHSFALEQIYLQPLEVPLARALAAQGFCVLRFQSQGYGDSELGASHASLSSHLDCARDALALLQRVTGVARVGFLGARFGASVAAVMARHTQADALAMWDPAIKGRSLVNRLVRQAVASELAVMGRRKGSTSTSDEPLAKLQETDSVDLQGFPLGRDAYEELMKMDLCRDTDGFKGESLVLQISNTDRPKADLRRLVDALGRTGAVSYEIVVNARASTFGGPRYRPSGDGGKQDTQGELELKLVEQTLRWATSLVSTEIQGARA